METKGTVCNISAFVPLETMFGYSTDMRSLSKGRANYSMEPSHFEQVPASLVENIVKTSSRTVARS
jgi:elongation factor G